MGWVLPGHLPEGYECLMPSNVNTAFFHSQSRECYKIARFFLPLLALLRQSKHTPALWKMVNKE